MPYTDDVKDSLYNRKFSYIVGIKEMDEKYIAKSIDGRVYVTGDDKDEVLDDIANSVSYMVARDIEFGKKIPPIKRKYELSSDFEWFNLEYTISSNNRKTAELFHQARMSTYGTPKSFVDEFKHLLEINEVSFVQSNEDKNIKVLRKRLGNGN